MRAIKTITISVLALGLLAGSAVGVAAQSSGGPAAVDGSITFDDEACIQTDEWNECPFLIEASDERLSGDGFVRNADVGFEGFDDGEGFMVIVNMSARVENADGAWSGGGPLYALPFDEEGHFGTDQPTWVLTGEGAYDGPTAVLRVDFDEFGGVIFEGELPAAPSLE